MNIEQNAPVAGTPPTTERAAWEAPKLARINVDSAETLPGPDIEADAFS